MGLEFTFPQASLIGLVHLGLDSISILNLDNEINNGDNVLTREFSLFWGHWHLLVLTGIFHRFKSRGETVCSIP